MESFIAGDKVTLTHTHTKVAVLQLSNVSHLKLVFRQHGAGGPVVDSHGVARQTVLLLQLGIQQVHRWGGGGEARVVNTHTVSSMCLSSHFANLAGQPSIACSNRSRARSSFLPPYTEIQACEACMCTCT